MSILSEEVLIHRGLYDVYVDAEAYMSSGFEERVRHRAFS
ncbi:hypothetical protein J2Z42_001418 [Clostridium algifaecis]|uniref:Uncharacterized protein n=1 Tax=Clostridium algifaecis TaxID=1472040 RepID=A0ABS4KRU2_9CLOT|nr:hypothetical protein [Clostridium algifaecis]